LRSALAPRPCLAVWFRPALALSLLLLLTTAFACGDDDGGDASLEIYFTEMEMIFDTATEEADEAEMTLDDSLSQATTFDERVEATSDYLTSVNEIFSDAAEQMDQLDVPGEASDDHADFVEAANQHAATAPAVPKYRWSNAASAPDAITLLAMPTASGPNHDATGGKATL